jgi:hypothetical protein
LVKKLIRKMFGMNGFGGMGGMGMGMGQAQPNPELTRIPDTSE